MKKYWTMLAIALISFCTISCGSDDDEDNGGSGSATLVVDGKKYSLGYAFYIPNGTGEGKLMFSNINIMGTPSMSAKWTYCIVNFPGITASNIPEGETTQASIEAFINQPVSGKGNPELGFGGFGTARVSKSGGKYTIDLEVTNITDTEGSVTDAKLHFSGKVVDASSRF